MDVQTQHKWSFYLDFFSVINIKKFKGDNDVSFNKWILQFEAQNDALGVENNKKRRYCYAVWKIVLSHLLHKG